MDANHIIKLLLYYLAATVELFHLFINFIFHLGHVVGMDHHDDEFFTHDPGNMLLMWPGVGTSANIWSPEAKRRIKEHTENHVKRNCKAKLGEVLISFTFSWLTTKPSHIQGTGQFEIVNERRKEKLNHNRDHSNTIGQACFPFCKKHDRNKLPMMNPGQACFPFCNNINSPRNRKNRQTRNSGGKRNLFYRQPIIKWKGRDWNVEIELS